MSNFLIDLIYVGMATVAAIAAIYVLARVASLGYFRTRHEYDRTRFNAWHEKMFGDKKE